MISSTILIDTGPLAALADARDQYHHWARQQAVGLAVPFLTCEAVWSETWFLLRGLPRAQEKLLLFLSEGLVQINFNSAVEVSNLVV